MSDPHLARWIPLLLAGMYCTPHGSPPLSEPDLPEGMSTDSDAHGDSTADTEETAQPATPPTHTDCLHWQATLERGLHSILPDLDGDGDDELVSYEGRTFTVIDGVDRRPLRRVHDLPGFHTWATGDVNADGLPDLVIGRPWDSSVSIWFGPHSGETSSFEEAPVRITAPSDKLSNLFGYGILSADVTGDGIDDLVVGAAGEAEENCYGMEPIRVFAGPVSPGTYQRRDADLSLPLGAHFCVGESLNIVDGSLVAGGWDLNAIYALPLDPTTPPTEIERPLTHGHGVWADDRGRLSWLLGDRVRQSDGTTIPLTTTTQPPVVPRLQPLRDLTDLWALMRTPGQDATWEVRGYPRVDDIVNGEITTWPLLATVETDIYVPRASAGDLDGDGRVEVVMRSPSSPDALGHLLRCRQRP